MEKVVKITDINIASDSALDEEYKDYDELNPDYGYYREEEEE